MESLRENKLLMYSILASSTVVIFLALGLSPDLLNTFQIIDFPDDVSFLLLFLIQKLIFFFPFQFRKILIAVLLADLILAFVVDRICSFLFGEIRGKSELVN